MLLNSYPVEFNSIVFHKAFMSDAFKIFNFISKVPNLTMIIWLKLDLGKEITTLNITEIITIVYICLQLPLCRQTLINPVTCRQIVALKKIMTGSPCYSILFGFHSTLLVHV